LADLAVKPADIVAANLTGVMLVKHATHLTDLLNPNGMLIVSGFAPDEQPAIEDAFLGLTVRGRAREGAWAATAFARASIRSRT
jgi:ribosomal protein L11 methylase PrmA